MTTLREAAQQALQALKSYKDMVEIERGCYLNEGEAAIATLRNALAKQVVPVAEPTDVARKMLDAGMTFHLGMPRAAVMEQMTRFHDLVCAEASIKAAAAFAAPPQRKPLTDEEILRIFRRAPICSTFARAIERAHGIGATE